MKMNMVQTVRRGGFTLVELIVAMAITSMLVLVIMQLTNQGVDLWKSVRQDVDTTTQSRSALQIISHDLESFQMVTSNNKYQWLAAKASDEMSGVPSGLKIPRSAQCVFFACAPDRNPAVASSGSLRSNYRDARAHNRDTQGDVNAIGYRLMFRDQVLNLPASDSGEGGAYPVFSLYRQVIPPRVAFENLMGKENLAAAYASYEADEEKNFLCENILEMNLTFDIRYAASEADAKDGRVSYDVVTVPIIESHSSGNRVAVYGDRIVAGGQSYKNARIIGANVAITVITEEGMAIVNQVRQGRRRAPKAADFFAKYTRSFSRMVTLPMPL